MFTQDEYFELKELEHAVYQLQTHLSIVPNTPDAHSARIDSLRDVERRLAGLAERV